MNATLRKTLLLFALLLPVAALSFAAGRMAAKNKYGMPKTVLHVVTLRWKANSTPAQQQQALEGVKTMAAEIPGIKNVWLKTVKVQGGTQEQPYSTIFAMEFESEAALKAYVDHPAHKEWEKVYVPLRDESRTSDVSNEAVSK